MDQLEAAWLAGYWLGVDGGRVGDWVLCCSSFNSLAWTCGHSVAGF